MINKMLISTALIILSISSIVSASTQDEPLGQKATFTQSEEKNHLLLEQKNQKAQREHIQKVKPLVESKLNEFKVLSPEKLPDSARKEIYDFELKQFEQLQKKIDANMKAAGYEVVEQPVEEKVSSGGPKGSYSIATNDPNDLTLSDNLYYNSSTGYYNFKGYWNWKDNSYDIYTDALDILAFRMNQRWLLGNSYIYTYDNHGTTTTAGTKRAEDLDGVLFNLKDKYYQDVIGTYESDNGQISVYFKKGSSSSSTNKVFLNFEHNYQRYVGSAYASINLVDLSASTLTVQYSKSNYSYPRASNGRSIGY